MLYYTKLGKETTPLYFTTLANLPLEFQAESSKVDSNLSIIKKLQAITS